MILNPKKNDIMEKPDCGFKCSICNPALNSYCINGCSRNKCMIYRDCDFCDNLKSCCPEYNIHNGQPITKVFEEGGNKPHDNKRKQKD